jgi:hypothetical protein
LTVFPMAAKIAAKEQGAGSRTVWEY